MSELKLHARLSMAAKGNSNRPMLAELLMEASQALRYNGWISVDERLPDDDGSVLVWPYPNETQLTGYYDSFNQWKNDENGQLIDVTHWMPLPEPPCAS